MRLPTFRIKTKARNSIVPDHRQLGHRAQKGRLTKSGAARILQISRRTIIRYAKDGLISEDRKGRVKLYEVADVLLHVPVKHGGPFSARQRFPLTKERIEKWLRGTTGRRLNYSAVRTVVQLKRKALLQVISRRGISNALPADLRLKTAPEHAAP